MMVKKNLKYLEIRRGSNVGQRNGDGEQRSPMTLHQRVHYQIQNEHAAEENSAGTGSRQFTYGNEGHHAYDIHKRRTKSLIFRENHKGDREYGKIAYVYNRRREGPEFNELCYFSCSLSDHAETIVSVRIRVPTIKIIFHCFHCPHIRFVFKLDETRTRPSTCCSGFSRSFPYPPRR